MHQKFSSLDTLKEWKETNDLEEFINILNNNNIVLDEENTFQTLTRNFMRTWNDECTKFIIANGYENFDAYFTCKGVKMKDNRHVYCLYDTNIIEPHIAEKYILNYKYNEL